MNVRQPFRAGSFYEASPATCRTEASALLDAAELPGDLPAGLVGGIVPHAGWVYSGHLAAMTFKALAGAVKSPTVVLLGADHCGTATAGEVYDRGAWASPLGEVEIDEPLAEALLAASDLLVANPAAHAREHSLEVQVPFIQLLWPGVKIVPILVAPSGDAVAIGEAVGRGHRAGRPRRHRRQHGPDAPRRALSRHRRARPGWRRVDSRQRPANDRPDGADGG